VGAIETQPHVRRLCFHFSYSLGPGRHDGIMEMSARCRMRVQLVMGYLFQPPCHHPSLATGPLSPR